MNNNVIVRPASGLHTDFNPIDQPEGTYRFALNAVPESTESDENYRFREKSNELCIYLKENYYFVDSLELPDNRIVIYSTDGTNSEIGLLEGKKYTTVVNNTCFKFHECNYVSSTFRIREGCKEIIYITNGAAPVRVVDLTDAANFDCEKSKLQPDFEIPCIKATTLITGGQIAPGSLSFGIVYSDSTGTSKTQMLGAGGVIRIYEDSNISDYDNLNGDFNIDVSPVNGIASTSKSVKIEVGNLSENYSHYQIVVASAEAGTGDAQRYFLSPPIATNISEYVYTGDLSTFTATTLAELRIEPANIETAKFLTQLENRLILSNTTERTYDFSLLQRAANDITTKYTVKEIPAERADVNGNNKSPNQDIITFAGDEIAAYAIVYVYRGGIQSPPIHIPGREATNFDRELVTVMSDDRCIYCPAVPLSIDPCDLEEEIPTEIQVERWQVENTASRVAVITSNCADQEGLMGYHESCSGLYPEITDCNGDFIYGDLAGTPIRHHRFPDRRLEPILRVEGSVGSRDFYARPLGVTFDNIVYPDPDIVDHFFVVANRNEADKTIFDSGVTLNVHGQYRGGSRKENFFSVLGTNVDYIGQLPFGPDSRLPVKSRYVFMSPKTQFNRQSIPLACFDHVSTLKLTNVVDEPDRLPLDFTDTINYFIASTYMEMGLIQPATGSYNIDKSIYADSGTGNDNFTDDGIINLSIMQDVNFIQLNGNLPVTPGLNLTEVRNPTNGVDLFGEAEVHYGTIKINRDVYNNLDFITYRTMLDCDKTAFYKGDNFISKMTVSDRSHDTFQINRRNDVYSGETLAFWVESEINTGLRSQGTGECERYLETNSGMNEFFRSKLANLVEDENGNLSYILKPVPCKDYFSYNRDYSYIDNTSLYVPLPSTFDFCSDCSNIFNKRTWFSQQSFQEERSDLYRIFLPNNYRDLEGETGEIEAIWTKNNNLYLHTKAALWQQPQSLQQQQTDELTYFIGSGDFLAIPPRRMLDSTMSGAGTKHVRSIISTPYGVLWVDELDSKVWLYKGEGLDAISNEGNRKWFDRHLIDHLGTQLFELSNVKFEGCVQEVNIHCGYDAETDRVLITKKDYTIREELYRGILGDSLLALNRLYFNPTDNKFYVKNSILSELEEVTIGDNRFFCNKSWTISYNVKKNYWLSWHSYQPNFYCQNRNFLFSAEGNGLYGHGVNNISYCNFYGTQYPFTLELVLKSNPILVKTIDTIAISTIAKSYSSDKKVFFIRKDITFNKVWFYNSKEVSGEMELLTKDDNAVDYMLSEICDLENSIYITRHDKDWRINYIRSKSIEFNEPLFCIDCDTDYRFTDKKFNDAIFDPSKDWKELENFEDKYLLMRLIFDTFENVELGIDYTYLNEEETTL